MFQTLITPATAEAIGLIAASITTLCWLPQALLVIKTKETKAISLLSTGMLLVGLALWLVYGLYLISWPLIGSNIVTFILVAIIFTLKLKHG